METHKDLRVWQQSIEMVTSQDAYDILSEQTTSVWKQLNSLISSVKNRLSPQDQLPF